jgi:hypothetical protein
MENENVKTIDSLRKSILKEAENISNFIRQKIPNITESIIKGDDDRNQIEETLVFDIPDWKRVKLNPQTLYFKDAGFNTVNWTIPVDKIHTYYQLHRILAYVYVNYKFCPLIYLATERVLYKHKIKEENNALTNSVFDQTQAVSGSVYEEAERIKQELSKNGYYDNYEDLMPLDKSLTNSFAIEKIQSVVKLLGRVECRKNRNTSTLDVERFLKQFDTSIQLPMLHLISNIKVLSPEDELPNAIIKIREGIDKNKKIGILPLGDFMNSSSNILKNIKDTFEENNITSINVNYNINNLENILVVDDNINTGIQCFNIMMRYLGYDKKNISDEKKQKEIWMDLESKRGDVQENITNKFSEELKKKHFEFLFIVGHETSADELTGYLKTYCKLKDFNITIIHPLKDNDRILSSEYGGYSENSTFGKIKENFDKNVKDREQIQKMRNTLKKVGASLVKNKDVVKKYKQKQDENALGYRNRENLLVFTNSIPTMTYTALWCEGKYNKKNWYPLIPRK